MSAVKSALKLLLVSLAFAGVILASGFYSVAVQLTQREGIPEGVTINGIDVSGMSEADARTAVLEAFRQSLGNISIEISSEGYTQTVTAEDAGAQMDLTNAIEELRRLLPANEGDMQKADRLLAYRTNGYDIAVPTQYDKNALLYAIEQFAGHVMRPPTNASAHMKEDGTFEYTDPIPGLMIDEQAAVEALYQKFLDGDLSPLAIETKEFDPVVTRSKVEQSTQQLGSFSTLLAGTSERITNIRLITDAVNGFSIEPGETLSLNGITGQRTPEKGYKEAPAISHGKLIDDTGGGVCQLAGTLYNAALLSELEIEERYRHTWPAAYLPVGQDATITWPNKDLKIHNNTEWPIYIHAAMDSENLTVTLYGHKGTEYEIQIEREIIETLKPAAPSVVHDPTKPPSFKQVVETERTGYYVRVYRRYYQEGSLIKEELLTTDRYAPIRGKVIIGSRPEIPEEIK